MAKINEPRIDIIIPTYKAHKTMFRLLSSISQQVISNLVDVTIVNDCCPEGNYNDIIKHFKSFLSIREIKMPKNGGPGLARQYGIDNTHNEYILFADADDTLGDSLSLRTLYRAIENDKNAACIISMFLEEGDNGIIRHEATLAWLHGKLFRRSFLEKHNIKFNSTRSCEDFGFNSKVYAIAEDKGMPFIDVFTYLWLNNNNSIARINNCQYKYDQCFRGMLENNIDTLKFMEDKDIAYERRKQHVLSTLVEAYITYNEILVLAPEYNEQSWYYSRKFYHYAKKYIDEASYDDWLAVYNTNIKEETSGNKTLLSLQTVTLTNFIETLQKAPFDINEIAIIEQRIPKKNIIKTKITGNYDSNIYKWDK